MSRPTSASHSSASDDAPLRELYEYGIRTPLHCRDREETGCIRPSAHARVVAFCDDVNNEEVIITEYLEHEQRWAVRLKRNGETLLLEPSQLRVNAKQPEGVPSAEEWLRAHGGGKTHPPTMPPFWWQVKAGEASLLGSSLLGTLIPTGDALDPGKFSLVSMSWYGILSGIALGGLLGWAHWQGLQLVSARLVPSGFTGWLLTTCAGIFWYYAVDLNVGPFLPSTEAGSLHVEVPAIACFAGALPYLGVDTCSRLLLLGCSIHHVRGAHADFDAFSKDAAKMKLRTPDDRYEEQLNEVISDGLMPIFRLGIGLGAALKIVSPLRVNLLGFVGIASFTVGARCFRARFYGTCGATAAGMCLFWYCSR